jgi:hypothetical protein
LPGAAKADPKQQQRLRLPEMEDLLDGVRVGLARRPSGEPLLRCSVLGLGFAKISRVRVSSSDAVIRRATSPSVLVKLGDSVADQRCRLCFPQTTATHKKKSRFVVPLNNNLNYWTILCWPNVVPIAQILQPN